jgi:hypothetical protein
MEQPMTKMLKPEKEFYSEFEAAAYLGISIHSLYSLLDEYIFNNGTSRPDNLTFRDSDLVLLAFWSKCQENPKVIRMPRRSRTSS